MPPPMVVSCLGGKISCECLGVCCVCVTFLLATHNFEWIHVLVAIVDCLLLGTVFSVKHRDEASAWKVLTTMSTW